MCQTATTDKRKRKRTSKPQEKETSSSDTAVTDDLLMSTPKPVSDFFAHVVSQLHDRSMWEWEVVCNLLRKNLAYGTYGLAMNMSATKRRLYRSIVVSSISLGNFLNIVKAYSSSKVKVLKIAIE